VSTLSCWSVAPVSRAYGAGTNQKQLTSKQLFRCRDCGWLGWLVSLDFGKHAPLDVMVTPDLGVARRRQAARICGPTRQLFSQKSSVTMVATE
jgi:hypothetical protein